MALLEASTLLLNFLTEGLKLSWLDDKWTLCFEFHSSMLLKYEIIFKHAKSRKQLETGKYSQLMQSSQLSNLPIWNSWLSSEELRYDMSMRTSVRVRTRMSRSISGFTVLVLSDITYGLDKMNKKYFLKKNGALFFLENYSIRVQVQVHIHTLTNIWFRNH